MESSFKNAFFTHWSMIWSSLKRAATVSYTHLCLAAETGGGKPQRKTMKLRGVVERITYQNPDNGYTVLKCAVKNYNDLVTVVGSLLDVNVGSVLLIDGNWKVDSKYGRQFMAETWEETMPATIFGIEKYLGSGLIKGVGPKFSKRIVQKFGTRCV